MNEKFRVNLRLSASPPQLADAQFHLWPTSETSFRQVLITHHALRSCYCQHYKIFDQTPLNFGDFVIRNFAV